VDRKKALVLMGELIGSEASVKKSVRKELEGLKGKVIDETLKTFIIEAGKRQTVVPKGLCVFDFGGVEVDGKDLEFRPEDRIKKYWRKFKEGSVISQFFKENTVV
jgi:ribonuclease P protein subunit POP4